MGERMRENGSSASTAVDAQPVVARARARRDRRRRATSGRLHRPPQMPGAGRFSTQHLAARDDGEHRGRLRRARPGRPCAPGSSAVRPVAPGHAIGAQRAALARGRRARAERGPQVHEPLRVGARRPAGRHAATPPASQSRACTRRRIGRALDAEMPREHPLHVAVEDRVGRAGRERHDRGGRRAADARQRLRRSTTDRGNPPGVPLDDRPRGAGAGCARGRSSRARSTGAAPRPGSPRRAPRTSGKRARKRS